MKRRVFDLLAPDHCYGCQKIGSVLCDNCKYDIESEPFTACLACRMPSAANRVCNTHGLAYTQTWCVGERHDTLEALIDAYKFERNIRAAQAVGQLLAARLSQLPSEAVLVPIPTVALHVRQRGFDHTEVMTREIARQLGCGVAPLLERRTASVQRQASRAVRQRQAAEAFGLTSVGIEPRRPYVIVDDVFTTGATVNEAAKQLQAAGASEIWVAIAARQPLDEQR